ncbi:TPA: TIR domain-containing protein [Pseudomonas putida]|nr:TIR domain-containing protein [Pseudomonas putida]
MTPQKKIFISYSWDSAEHQEWVSKLAGDLEVRPEFHVIWDGYDLDSLIDKNLFMEESVRNADYTLIVATKNYAKKANNREGGVGIETYLNSAAHWKKMLEDKRTNTIVLLREEDATPSYMQGHFYINFTNDQSYPTQIQDLIGKLNSKPQFVRPQKATTPAERKVYTLTKAGDIISIGARNRQCVITSSEGTDFSGGHKIKFELWHTASPVVMHILALHNNINISQTLHRAVDEIVRRDIEIENLTVLRPKEKRKNAESIDDILAGSNYRYGEVKVADLSYDDYIWRFCIDESFKEVQAPDVIDFYTEQELSSGNVIAHKSAVKHLIEKLTNESGCCTQLVIGSGGIGKTSLCLSLAAQLIKNHRQRILTILIRSEDIRKFIDASGISPAKIDSIYDIYELQAKYLQHSNLFDKKTFELSIISGSVAIIVDGLDELSSIFKEKFDLKRFLASVDNLHTELGYGRVLLTTRDSSILSNAELESMSFESYELLGFKTENCKKYLERRFKHHELSGVICEKIIKKLADSGLATEDRITPFFVDVIANIFEESSNESEGAVELNVMVDPTPYPSLNEITDHIIYSIFDREKTRHRFELTPKELVELFCYLNQEFGKLWTKHDIEETASLMHGHKGEEINKYLLKNPLLTPTSRGVKFKYDFLNSYFNSLSLFSGFTTGEGSISFAKSVSRLTVESNELKDIVKYFSDSSAKFLSVSKDLVGIYKGRLTQEGSIKAIDKSIYTAAIENLILLCHLITKSKKETFSAQVREMYGNALNQIEHLYLKGDLPSFDFSNLTVTKSRFSDYPKFLGSTFDGAHFMYSEFANCHNAAIRTSDILKAKFDRDTCSLGDLAESINVFSASSKASDEQLSLEAEYFLNSFYRGSVFRDNNKTHIRFSTTIPGLGIKKFGKILGEGYLCISVEKEVDVFYKISDHFKSSVRRFLNDGYKDAKMKAFLKFARG